MHEITLKKSLRYTAFLLIIAVGFSFAVLSRGTSVETEEIKLYLVDAQMLRLVPVKMSIPKMPPQKQAKRVLEELIEGRDDNPKIRRLIPKDKGCMTVKVKNKIAYVDINSDMTETVPDGRDLEELMIYSIVNTLTGLNGIVNVRFTIDGETQREFKGYIDMRETFIPDYFV